MIPASAPDACLTVQTQPEPSRKSMKAIRLRLFPSRRLDAALKQSLHACELVHTCRSDRPASIPCVGTRLRERPDRTLRADCRLRHMADYSGRRSRGGGQDHPHHCHQCRRRLRARLVYPASRRRDPIGPASRRQQGAGPRARDGGPGAVRRFCINLARSGASRPRRHFAAHRGGRRRRRI